MSEVEKDSKDGQIVVDATFSASSDPTSYDVDPEVEKRLIRKTDFLMMPGLGKF
jgi:hypothetical protein